MSAASNRFECADPIDPVHESLLSIMHEQADSKVSRALSLDSVEELTTTLQLLGFDDFADRVISMHYHNWMGGASDNDIYNPVVPSEVSVEEILEKTGDLGGLWCDHPNDFISSVALDLDQSTAVVIQHHSEECALICKDCTELEETKLNEEYSCYHNEGDYDIVDRFQLLLCSKDLVPFIPWQDDLDRLQDYFSHVKLK